MAKFEGVEKRLELVFDKTISLRATFTKDKWEKILVPVGCVIKDELIGDTVDTYVLSTSSLFVFDDRIVIKTCGETNLFEAISGILIDQVKEGAIAVKYTRGTYLWPEKQPSDHQNFDAEALKLEDCFKGFQNKIKEKLGENKEQIFHLYADGSSSDATQEVTLEILMTGLDKTKSAAFFESKETSDSMTRLSGIDQIFLESKICAHEFTPCGYSMNGVQGDGDSVYTIHVTPEEEFSFASFETYGYKFEGKDDFNNIVEKVLDCFMPACYTVIVHYSNSTMELLDLDIDGRTHNVKDVKDLGSWGTMVYYSF